MARVFKAGILGLFLASAVFLGISTPPSSAGACPDCNVYGQCVEQGPGLGHQCIRDLLADEARKYRRPLGIRVSACAADVVEHLVQA